MKVTTGSNSWLRSEGHRDQIRRLTDDDDADLLSLSDCATHSKKQIALEAVRSQGESEQYDQAHGNMRNTTSNSMMHGLEAYINGLQASSKLTKGIYARLNRAQEV